jgi:hypothetical protein
MERPRRRVLAGALAIASLVAIVLGPLNPIGILSGELGTPLNVNTQAEVGDSLTRIGLLPDKGDLEAWVRVTVRVRSSLGTAIAAVGRNNALEVKTARSRSDATVVIMEVRDTVRNRENGRFVWPHGEWLFITLAGKTQPIKAELLGWEIFPGKETSDSDVFARHRWILLIFFLVLTVAGAIGAALKDDVDKNRERPKDGDRERVVVVSTDVAAVVEASLDEFAPKGKWKPSELAAAKAFLKARVVQRSSKADAYLAAGLNADGTGNVRVALLLTSAPSWCRHRLEQFSDGFLRLRHLLNDHET